MADSNEFHEGNGEYGDIKIPDKKSVRLSLHLIVKRHLPKEAEEWSHEKIICELNKIRRVRLDRENVGQIDSMELLSSDVTHLFLQSNQIKVLENLECLPNLQVLVLSRNQISMVEGISHLEKLVFLDLSENNITHASSSSFPTSIVILNLKGNPCMHQEDFRDDLKNDLPKLKQLNEVDLINEDFSDEEIDDDNDDDDEKEDDFYRSNGNVDDNAETKMDQFHDDSGLGASSIDPTMSSRLSLGSNYKQLPNIQSSIPDMATEMLMRSQDRLEETANQHRRHIQEMTNIKIKSKIRPCRRMSKP